MLWYQNRNVAQTFLSVRNLYATLESIVVS
jgi:hypothetical protein